MSSPVDDVRGRGSDGPPGEWARGADALSGRMVQEPSGGLRRRRGRRAPVYGALDLGTNNCRLLIARPEAGGFRVVDAFSRIIRLGEGVGRTGRLGDAAMARTIDALGVCTQKMTRRRVRRARLIATEACRAAENGAEFVARVHDEIGLKLEIISRETEAELAVAGCAALLDPACRLAVVFDIGGGSSELMLVGIGEPGPPDDRRNGSGSRSARVGGLGYRILAWTSMPVGVVTLAERFGGVDVDQASFARMVEYTGRHLERFAGESRHLTDRHDRAQMHLLGTSGTVTTIAGVHLGLGYYDRSRVDGCWLTSDQTVATTERLLALSYDDRVRAPCIGRDRADLVLAGCAILEAVMQAWPCERLRVADRGLREGILSQLMAQDGYLRPRAREPVRACNGSGTAPRP